MVTSRIGDNMRELETLKTAIRTLESLEVSGRINMEKVLGVIYALEQLSKEIEVKETEDGR